jgi:hypothetical protein
MSQAAALLGLLLLLAGTSSCSVGHVIPKFDQARLPAEFDKLDQIDTKIVDPKQKLADLEATYQHIQSTVDALTLDGLTDENLDDYFRANNRLAFYSMDPVYVHEMRNALSALARRGPVQRSMREDLLEAYVQARLFNEASAFSYLPLNSDLQKPPAFLGGPNTAAGPRVWDMTADGSTMTSIAVPIDHGLKVLVISSPWCHFSQAAVQAISKDRDLGESMKQRSIWIMPAVRIPDFADIRLWNEKYPGQRMYVVDRQSEWPMISSWATPGFYFLRDGRLLDTVFGWPGPEQLKHLKDALARFH